MDLLIQFYYQMLKIDNNVFAGLVCTSVTKVPHEPLS